ncbi:MAG: N-acetylmuramoyl-L-alanine amidase [Clostridiales bacterium]|nr:N-acetylmuramoyl-L-alanine amidase [Clostridiales bacterium]
MEKKIRKGVKLFQYFMILIVFVAALILPRYAVDWQAANLLENEISGAARTSEEMNEVQNGQTIVIDPGHGGDDPGMIGESGVSEKVLNLIYAQKLAVLLEAEGYEVVLTRTTENGLYDADASNKKAQDMQRRVAMIEEEDPVLTVSIHQNSYPEDSSVKGPQVFYYEQSAEGEKLATAIQDSLNEELEIERPRVQKGNTTYYILKRSVSTTVIVECGFLTNPEEEALLQEDTYQDRVVQAIFDGILTYLLDKNEYH